MRLRLFGIAGLMLAALPGPADGGLMFNISGTGNAAADAAFAAAGARWSSLFSDNITINITAGYANLGGGILASAGSTEHIESYATVRSALIADKTSADDTTATANLQAGSALTILINQTSNSPNGSGSAMPYVDSDGDANNTTISMNSANAKALGLLVGNDPIVDAAITFNNNSAFNFDFDPTNGIAAGFYDFIGIATHEIGHALGFVSGVDILDFYSQPRRGGPFPDDQFTFVSTLDLFRYSALSKANSAIDWTADNRVKFFSIDGGTTMGASFSNGVNFGDGQQASHWKDNLGLGIMDPTAGRGELLSITANDIRAFDVIGYNLNNSSVAVPEPSSIALWGLGALGIAFARRYRK